jgi:hypothetical protein
MSIIMGFLILALITPIIIMAILSGEMTPKLFCSLMVFEVTGFAFIIGGIMTIIKKIGIKKCTKICYGAVNEIRQLPTDYDEDNKYKAIIKIYNSEKNIYEEIERDIEKNKYQVNSFLLCKYYKNEIYIQETIPSSEVPENIRINLLPTQEQIHNMHIEISLNKEYVYIGKTRYKKI